MGKKCRQRQRHKQQQQQLPPQLEDPASLFPLCPCVGGRIIGGGPVQMGHLLTGVGAVRRMATAGQDVPTTRTRSSCKPRPQGPPHYLQCHHLHHHPKKYGIG
ncbi:UNVERIFIED_CONTAM: hypothetical protein FKN15_038047 [Acipenser sinensis]